MFKYILFFAFFLAMAFSQADNMEDLKSEKDKLQK